MDGAMRRREFLQGAAVGPLHGTHEPPFYLCGSDHVAGYMEEPCAPAGPRPPPRWAPRSLASGRPTSLRA